MKQKSLFVIFSLITILSYGYFAFAAAPLGGYNPGDTLNPDCAPGDTDCIVALTTGGGSSQWDDVTNGINYAGGNVGIGTTTPDARLKITGQNPNNYVFLLGGDSSETQNNFGIHLQDNGPDQFGVIDMYASPEESFILNAAKLDGSYSGSFRLSTQGITNISSSDDVGNFNNFEFNQYGFSTTVNDTSNSFQLLTNTSSARFIPSNSTRGGVYIGNGNILSGDEAGLYDAGSDMPLVVFDAPNNRIYYTPQMFVDYDGSYIGLSNTHDSLGGISVNYADGSINIGRAETNAADGIEGIQVYQSGNNPVVKLGSSGFSGNGTNIIVDDVNETIGFNFSGGSYIFPTADGSVGQVLTTDGTGNITWEDVSGGGGSSPITIVNSSSLFSTGLSNTGAGATGAYDSIFFGEKAGQIATDAHESNFFGYQAGRYATNADNSNFFGQSSGQSATNASYSNFLGQNAGESATNASDSNFFGNSAGYQSTGAHESNFFGPSAGRNAANAAYANFFGPSAGRNATDAYSSNFFGNSAGNGAINAYNANFFGYNAGYGATGAGESNFLGSYAGYNAISANNSNFSGFQAGYEATNAYRSNFLGVRAGGNATNASNSNFLGEDAGFVAINASHSFFVGQLAGAYESVYNVGTPNAANSIFIGREAAYTSADYGLDNTGNTNDFSILLGNYTSTGGFENSIALGQRATNTASNEFMIGSATRPINTLVLTGASGNTCTLDVTVASPSCSSDERLKTNVEDLTNDTLEKVLNIKTVSYEWNNFPEKGTQIGFLAQDLEQYFPEVVSEAPNGFKTVSYGGMTPILVQAIREMNLKITDINNTETSNPWRDALIAWFGNTANGITELFAGRVRTHELCLDDVCVTKDQLQQLLQNSQQTIVPSSSGNPPADPEITPDDTTPSDSDPIESPDDSDDSNSNTSIEDTPTE